MPAHKETKIKTKIINDLINVPSLLTKYIFYLSLIKPEVAASLIMIITMTPTYEPT